MSTNIVNTSFKLTSTYDNSGIRAAIKDQDDFSRQLAAGTALNAGGSSAVQPGSGIGSALARNLQQAGFATQDFISQWNNAKNATDGFARGISAISNNIQVLGAGLPPMQQAMFAIGGAAAGIIVPAVAKWLDDSHKIEEQTKAIEASYKSLKSLVEGLNDVGKFGAGLSNGDDAQKRLDSLRDERSALARQSGLLKQKIEEEMAGANDPATVGALRKHNDETAAEYEKLNIRIQTIEQHWTATRLKEAKDRREQQKKDKEAEKTIEEDAEKGMAELRKSFADEARAEDEKIRHQYDLRQSNLRNQIEDLRDQGNQNANGPSPASIRGTGAAVSAISRAISGTRSEEGDRKHQIKLLEDQLKVLNRLEQKMNFQRAGLQA